MSFHKLTLSLVEKSSTVVTWDGYPALLAVKEGQQLSPWCVFCKKWHRHGLGNGHRSPHCHNYPYRSGQSKRPTPLSLGYHLLETTLSKADVKRVTQAQYEPLLQQWKKSCVRDLKHSNLIESLTKGIFAESLMQPHHVSYRLSEEGDLIIRATFDSVAREVTLKEASSIEISKLKQLVKTCLKESSLLSVKSSP